MNWRQVGPAIAGWLRSWRDPRAALRASRSGFRGWRRSRPFWGGLLAIAGGAEILLIAVAPLPVVIHQGIAGISSLLMGFLMIAAGLLAWFQPAQRAFFGIVIVVLSLASFVTSNMGGFLIGMLLGIVGGSLAFAWAPLPAGGGDGGAGAAPAERPSSGNGPQALVVLVVALVTAGVLRPGAAPAAPCPTTTTATTTTTAPTSSTAPPTTEDRGLVGGLIDLLLGGSSSAPATSTSTTTTTTIPGQQPPCDTTPPSDGSPPPATAPGGGGSPPPTTAPGGGEAPPTTVAPAPQLPTPPGHPLIAVDPPLQRADKVDMFGLTFDGVVELPSIAGPVRTLQFSMDRMVLRNYELEVTGPGGSVTRFDTPLFVLRGNVRVNVSRMSGKLFGVVPVTFTPDSPPPLVTPVLFFTEFSSEQRFVVTDVLETTDEARLRLRVG